MDNFKLTLFAKLPIYLDGIPIYSPTIKEIAEVTEDCYSMFISISTITRDRLKIKNELSNYDVLKDWLLADKNNLFLFMDALFFWTKIQFNVNVRENNELYFYYEKIINEQRVRYELNSSNYDQFVEIIKFANCIKNEETKPKGKAVLEIEEKIRIAKEKINQKLNKKDKELNIYDLTSVLAANGNGLNALNVVDLNIFMFQDQFQRMQIIEDYDIQIRSLLAGAEIKDIKHYTRKL